MDFLGGGHCRSNIDHASADRTARPRIQRSVIDVVGNRQALFRRRQLDWGTPTSTGRPAGAPVDHRPRVRAPPGYGFKGEPIGMQVRYIISRAACRYAGPLIAMMLAALIITLPSMRRQRANNSSSISISWRNSASAASGISVSSKVKPFGSTSASKPNWRRPCASPYLGCRPSRARSLPNS